MECLQGYSPFPPPPPPSPHLIPPRGLAFGGNLLLSKDSLEFWLRVLAVGQSPGGGIGSEGSTAVGPFVEAGCLRPWIGNGLAWVALCFAGASGNNALLRKKTIGISLPQTPHPKRTCLPSLDRARSIKSVSDFSLPSPASKLSPLGSGSGEDASAWATTAVPRRQGSLRRGLRGFGEEAITFPAPENLKPRLETLDGLPKELELWEGARPCCELCVLSALYFYALSIYIVIYLFFFFLFLFFYFFTE